MCCFPRNAGDALSHSCIIAIIKAKVHGKSLSLVGLEGTSILRICLGVGRLANKQRFGYMLPARSRRASM